VSPAATDFRCGLACVWFLRESAKAREVLDAADSAAPDYAFGMYANDADQWASQNKQTLRYSAMVPGTTPHVMLRMSKHGRILIGKTENPNPEIAPPHEAE